MTVDIYGASPPMYVPLLENTYKQRFGSKYGVRDKSTIKQLYLMNMCIENSRHAAKSANRNILNAKDLKSCLKLCLNDRTIYNKTVQSAQNNLQNNRRKKVSFADAHGKKLTLVKYLTRPSNEPPELDILNDVIMNLKLSYKGKGPEKNSSSSSYKLKPKFEQPVSDYLNFKMRLESNNVCVENALVNDNKIKGTIKVKNIDFHKIVTVVITFDDWKTKSNVFATYINSPYDSAQYDTFQFEITVPSAYQPHKHNIQFCVKYDVQGIEYWDNNDNLNYTIASECQSPRQGQHNHNSIYAVPSLYSELPQPECNTWKSWENERFY